VTLKERLQADTTAAMRSGDALRRDTLRMVQNSAYNLEKKSGKPLTEEELLAVFSREVKTRRESVEAFRKGGREDLASKEEAEIAILGDFLPEQLSEAALIDLIAQAVAATGAVTPRDLGKVMGWLAPHTRGRADGEVVSTLVAARLAGSTGPG
jgi:uncharacterized protein YqeY